VRAPNNTSKWEMGFNSVVLKVNDSWKKYIYSDIESLYSCEVKHLYTIYTCIQICILVHTLYMITYWMQVHFILAHRQSITICHIEKKTVMNIGRRYYEQVCHSEFFIFLYPFFWLKYYILMFLFYVTV
jgi:hypothetical protein